MIRAGFEIHAHRDPYLRDSIGIYLVRYDEDGQRELADHDGAHLVFRQHRRGLSAAPTLEIPPERAQQLMDDLWSAGLRPTEGRQSEGVTAAQARHLEDMRAIAFNRLKVEQPEAASK